MVEASEPSSCVFPSLSEAFSHWVGSQRTKQAAFSLQADRPRKVLILSFGLSLQSRKKPERLVDGDLRKEMTPVTGVSEDRLECGQRFQDSP